ncbi:MAG TPA: glycosyl hydrolase [Bryobacteraceae bacterium]|nr:glycosyl hydrolase [Bryobacteraceae bacterium]
MQNFGGLRTATRLLLLPLLATGLMAQRPWQQITVPSVRDAAANFKAPPHEYGAIQPFTSWNGSDPKEIQQRIVRDLDKLSANGMFIVNISPGRGEPKYLSPEHMAEVKFIVQEAAKRGMKLWIQDESDYPSGFAGGKISQEYPQLTMQGIDADIQIKVMPGQTVTMPTPPDTLGALAVFPTTGAVEPVKIDSKEIHWRAPAPPAGASGYPKPWELLLVRHMYRSSPTRNNNREDGTRAKDSQYALIDYLNPQATDAFLKITHETYKEAVGNEFGKTILGFFGDEPDYTCFIPWTPKLLDDFRQQKGYDLQPYLPLFFAPKMTDQAFRVKADYYDVWSGIFRDSFFGEQAAWCARNNVEYLVHLNHEETGLRLELPEDLTRNEGDYFRDMRHVQVPGIDNLSQLVPNAVHRPDGTWDINNNFPKLASSAAHLFGRPQVWSEEGGGLGVDGKYQLDFQLVRGVDALQIRFPLARAGGNGPGNRAAGPEPPNASMLAWYTNRAAYLMAIGRPAAQVGLYHPVNSLWLGDEEADRSTTKLGWELLEHQIDWDYFDEQSLSSVAKIEDGGFKNLSGQVYKAIIIPTTEVITRTGLERLQEFAKAGGKVIFVGKTPKYVVDKTFLNAKDAPDLSFATLIEPSGDITPRVIAALPKPDVALDSALPRLTYTHRTWRDGDMYFFFNESDKEESRMATVEGRGQAQDWDLNSGLIHPMSAAKAENGMVQFPLVLGPYETKVVVIGPLPGGVAAAEPSFAAGETLAALDGDWQINLNGKEVTTPLKSWESLGAQSFAGPVTYHKEFTASAVPSGKQVYLEMADVHDYARVKLNGKELEAHAWQPYRWDVTREVKAGTNDLEVEVRATVSGRRAFGGAPPVIGTSAPAGGAGGGGRRRGAAEPAASGLLGPVRVVAR